MHSTSDHQRDSVDAELLEGELLDGELLEAVTRAFAVSAKTREVYPSIPNQHYGPAVEEYLDIYPAEVPNAPILVFLPGGFAGLPMLAQDFAGVARGPYAHGITTVIVNYGQGPAATPAEVGGRAGAAIAWVYNQADRFGADRERIVVAGHSTGARLAVGAAVTDWEADYGLPADVVKAVLSVSGRFQPESANRWQSWGVPLRRVDVPLVVVRGDREPEEIRRQSAEFLAAWTASGNSGATVDLPGRSQHDTYASYADSASPLTLSTVEMIDSTRPYGSAGLAALTGR